MIGAGVDKSGFAKLLSRTTTADLSFSRWVRFIVALHLVMPHEAQARLGDGRPCIAGRSRRHTRNRPALNFEECPVLAKIGPEAIDRPGRSAH
jgi:hypothetical protein